VQITGGFFPHLDRNPNTGRPPSAETRLTATTQSIYLDAARASFVTLPVANQM
jgi:predicted acyl esterase